MDPSPTAGSFFRTISKPSPRHTPEFRQPRLPAAPSVVLTSRMLSRVSALPSWTSLGTPEEELRLEFTLPTGQSFRWRKTADCEYTGVIGHRVVQMRQLPHDVEYRVIARGPAAPPKEDEAAIHDYFNMATKLCDLRTQWSACDPRYKSVTPYFPGNKFPFYTFTMWLNASALIAEYGGKII